MLWSRKIEPLAEEDLKSKLVLKETFCHCGPSIHDYRWHLLENCCVKYSIGMLVIYCKYEPGDLEESRGELYVYTGPIYEGRTTKTIGKNKVAVPSHLYEIVYDPNRQEAIAFIMPNEALRTEDMPLYIVSVRGVEDRTGLNFLSAFDRQLQDTIETTKAEGLWQ